MRKIQLICLLICLCLLLAACSLAPAASPEGEPAVPASVEEPQAAPAAAPAPETAGEDAAPSPEPTSEPVLFAAGGVPGDAEELSLVLEPGETAKLDLLPALRKLDARGSACYEELCAWGEEHPEVELLYTVPLPGLGETENGTESLDFTALTAQEREAALPLLAFLPRLRELRLPDEEAGLSLDGALAVARDLPEVVVDYPFTLYGQEVNLADEQLVLFHIPVDDQGEAVRRVLPCMHACTWLDMDSCGVDNQHMAVIRDENPEVDVIWRVWFADQYSVRTNVTTILASMPGVGGDMPDSRTEGLYYCTKVRYLDLGHNIMLTDFSFVRNMPDLEVAIISMASIEDLSPFSSCSKLLYLEMGNTKVSDLSPLAACTNLKHLNIGTNAAITDISPLYDLDLKRLWIGDYTPIPAEQVEKMQELHPKCTINTQVPSGLPNAQGVVDNEGYTIDWKSWQPPINNSAAHPIGYYKVVFKIFRYDYGGRSYAFCWNDPKYTGSDPFVTPINVSVFDTSFLSEDWEEDKDSLVVEELEDPPGGFLYAFEH